MTPIASNCDPSFRAAHDSGKRPPGTIVRWIVLHDAEAHDAKGVARFFTTQAAQGSAHLVVDDDSCYRCLPNDVIPWAAPGANLHGFHIEQCGFASWSKAQWMQHERTLRRAAYKTAWHAVNVFKVPIRFVTATDLFALKHGITTHHECTKAFGGDHVDPGPGWPRTVFMRYVREYAAQLNV